MQMALNDKGEPGMVFGIVKVESVPASTGVHVVCAEGEGSVAVCVPGPIDTYAWFGPSLTMRTVLPVPGSLTEAHKRWSQPAP
jgi:hypothetical protein